MFKRKFFSILAVLSFIICNTAFAEQPPLKETYQRGEEIEEGVFLFTKLKK